MKYSSDDVNVSDPVYVVRKRLGEQSDEGVADEQVDDAVVSGIRTDYEQEMGDVLSDMNGGEIMGDPMEQFEARSDMDMSDAEQKERMKKFMRVSSLQIAYQAYPVFKSIVMN